MAEQTTTAKKAPAKRKPASDFSSRAQEMSRNAFLASLGFYGKAFDQAQEQFDNLQEQLEARRKKADKTYKELVKRGKKVEKDAKEALDDIDLPKFELESLTDRTQLEARLKKAKARFEELRESVGL
jgi:chromosome segregation ATPase